MTVSNSTVSGNTVSAGGGEGGGILINSGTLTVSDSTVSGNTAGSNGGNGVAGGIFGAATITNSIVAGNTTNGVANSDDCDGCGAQSSYNLIGGGAPALGTLAASPARSGLQTMMPLPGATTILCAGSSTLLPAGVTTDERGFPMDPSCPSGTIDLGAAQTHFTQAVSTGYNGVVNQVISPSPTVELWEQNAITGVSDGVGGIPITVIFGGNGTLTGNATVTTAPVQTGNGFDNLAVYAGMSVNLPGTGDSFSPVINGIGGCLHTQFGANISEFNIDAATTTQLAFGAPPATRITAGGNAGTVTVLEESVSGVPINSATDSITLTVTLPDSSQHQYTATAVGGIATFNLTAYPLTEAGTYSYSAALSTNASATTPTPATETVTAMNTAASLTVTGYPTAWIAGVANTATVEALDAYGNPISTYSGTATVSTPSDPASTITPNPVTLSSGTGTVTVTFATAGTQSIVAQASGLASGSETGIQITRPHRSWLP